MSEKLSEKSDMSMPIIRLERHIVASDNSDMPISLKSLVATRLAELERSPAAAAEKGGLTRTFIYDLLDGPDDRKVGAGNLQKLAKAIDMTPEKIVELTGAVTKAARSAVESEINVVSALRLPPTQSMSKDVPVMGTAMGSVFQNVEGFAFIDGPVDYARRPEALVGVKGVYAIYVVNDSMYPMHCAGELRFVSSHKPPAIGGSVIVQTRSHDEDPGQAYIKVLRKRTSEKIILEQFNPPATIEIPLRFVLSVHHVYTMNELFGA